MLRQAGTERPYTGEYWDTHTAGVYQCRACGAELFTSNEKFDSHCGWPSFWAPLAEGTVRYIHDRTLGMDRVEVRCANCDSHLGHVFEGEGYGTPTDQRYCINSVSLKLVPAETRRPARLARSPDALLRPLYLDGAEADRSSLTDFLMLGRFWIRTLVACYARPIRSSTATRKATPTMTTTATTAPAPISADNPNGCGSRPPPPPCGTPGPGRLRAGCRPPRGRGRPRSHHHRRPSTALAPSFPHDARLPGTPGDATSAAGPTAASASRTSWTPCWPSSRRSTASTDSSTWSSSPCTPRTAAAAASWRPC